jgi:hypothetical protein
VVGLVGLAVVLLVVGVALQRNDLQTAASNSPWLYADTATNRD